MNLNQKGGICLEAYLECTFGFQPAKCAAVYMYGSSEQTFMRFQDSKIQLMKKTENLKHLTRY